MTITHHFKFIFSVLMIIISFFLMNPAVLADSGAQNAINGLNTTAKQGYGTLPSVTDPSSVIGRVVGAALAFLGVVFFVLMIYGGYLWMFSMGNEQTVTKAKDVIIAAAIGLIIILMAYVITSFIGATFTAT